MGATDRAGPAPLEVPLSSVSSAAPTAPLPDTVPRSSGRNGRLPTVASTAHMAAAATATRLRRQRPRRGPWLCPTGPLTTWVSSGPGSSEWPEPIAGEEPGCSPSDVPDEASGPWVVSGVLPPRGGAVPPPRGAAGGAVRGVPRRSLRTGRRSVRPGRSRPGPRLRRSSGAVSRCSSGGGGPTGRSCGPYGPSAPQQRRELRHLVLCRHRFRPPSLVRTCPSPPRPGVPVRPRHPVSLHVARAGMVPCRGIGRRRLRRSSATADALTTANRPDGPDDHPGRRGARVVIPPRTSTGSPMPVRTRVAALAALTATALAVGAAATTGGATPGDAARTNAAAKNASAQKKAAAPRFLAASELPRTRPAGPRDRSPTASLSSSRTAWARACPRTTTGTACSTPSWTPAPCRSPS